MIKSFYRFRSTKNLLGRYNELEEQTIYFAPPEQLNDPMEGYRDIFWSGDLIAWKNLFSHYIFCLEGLCSLYLVAGEGRKLNANDIPIFGSTDHYPTDLYKKLFSKIKKRFLDTNEISSLLNSIAQRSTPVRKAEITFYFNCIHLPALKIINDVYIEENLTQETNRISEDCFSIIRDILSEDLIRGVEKLITDGEIDEVAINNLFMARNHISEQMHLIGKYSDVPSGDISNKTLIISEFASTYLSRLEDIVFPKWYTSCFMSECKNSSVWGHYGDNHSGMCLIFEPVSLNHKSFIKLNELSGVGSSGPFHGKLSMEFHPVNYKDGFLAIDFFTSIGSLPIPVLNKMWYMDDEGNTSICAHKMNTDEHAWRSSYWANFIKGLTVKSKDWEYENEYRLILHSSLIDFSEKDARKLTYDFSSLKGIIFGINTKEEDKIKTIQIIKGKCKKHSRTDFKFYQAYYCSSENCIKSIEMALVDILDLK